MNSKDRYIHDFSSCSRTYATLSIYHDSESPKKITESLCINPDSMISIGDIIRRNKKASKSGWFFGTQDKCQSRDLRAHIELILEALEGKNKILLGMEKSGFEMRLLCFWGSATGNGGPILDHQLISALSQYPIDIHFDIYFEGEDV